MRKTINFARLAEKEPKILGNKHAVAAFYASDPKFTGPVRSTDIDSREMMLGLETSPEPLKLTRKEIKEPKALPYART